VLFLHGVAAEKRGYEGSPFVACQMPVSAEQNAVYDIFEHAVAFTLTDPDSFRLTTGGRDNLEADELLPQILRLAILQD
jgi:hypothetical protein